MEWETTDPPMVSAAHTGMASGACLALPVRDPQARHGAHGDTLRPPLLRLTHAPLCSMIVFPESRCLQRRMSDF
jgi:hypothetical protein